MILKYLKIMQICIVFTFLQIVNSTNLFGQVVSKVTKYSICQWDKLSKTEFDCEKKWGQMLFSKIVVIPNREIETTFFTNGKDAEIIKYIWNDTKVKMNEDKTLYIYDLLERDINFEDGFIIVVFLRLNYTVQWVKEYTNIQGKILCITLYTE